jgi:TP901 family phage tail tape measure protein
MGIVVSQLVANISVSGAQQAQTALQGTGASSNQAQNNLNQLQKAAQDAGSILANRFSAEVKNAQSGLQELAVKADAAGLDVSTFASLQMKASEAAARLGVAQAQAAAAMEKANLVTNDASSSAEKIALAQAKATLAAENVAKAELAAGDAMTMVAGEATRLSDALEVSGVKSNLFAGTMGGMKERASGFFGGIMEAGKGLLDFGSKLGMTLMGVQMMASMFMGAADSVGKMIGDYQQGLTKLTTTAGESAGNLKMVGDGMLAMAGPTATSVKSLGDAMYWVESGGAHGKKALEDLKIAAMGAKAENADLTDVTKALMFTLNNYGSTGLTAAGAMNTLITAVGEGSLTLQGLTSGISNVMPTANAFGISLTDVAAGLATMSSQGDDASAAATHLAMMIKTIEAPATAGSKALASIGLTTQQVTDEMRVSLPGALDLIVTKLKDKFPEGSTAYNEALKAISGGSRSMQAILETTGTHLDIFKQNVDKITGAVKSGGDSIAGWAAVQQNFNFRMDQAKDAVGALAIKMGTALAPAATQLIGFFVDTAMPALNRFSDWFIKDGIPGVQKFGDYLGIAGGWLNTFVGHGQGAIPILSGIGAVIATLLVPAVWGLASGVIAATWPFLAIAVAVGGLTAVFLHFYNTSAQFRDFIAGVGVVMQQIGAFIVSTFTPVWQQLVEVWNSQIQPALAQLMSTFNQLKPELTVLAEIIGGVLLYQIGVLVADIGFLAGALSGIWKGAAEMIGGYVQIFSGYVQIIAGVISFIIDLFTGKFSKLGPDLKVILGGVGEIFTGFGNVLKGIVDGIVGGVVGGFKGMGVSVLGYLNDIVHGVHDKTEQASDAAKQHTLEMKIAAIKNAEETDLGVIQKLDHMRMGIADELSRTTDDTKKHALEIKLTQVTHAEDTAVKVWESHKKMRTDSESELDKLKKSSAEKFGTVQKDIQGIFGNIGGWFTDRWHDVQGAFGTVGNWFHDRWQEAWNGTTWLFGTIGKWFEDRWHDVQNVFAGIGKWFSDRWGEVMASTAPFRTYMGDVFQTIWNILVALWGKLGAKFNEWFNDAKVFFTPFVNFVHDTFAAAWGKVTAVWDFLGKYFGDRWDDTKKVLGFVGGVFYVIFKGAWDKVVGVWDFLSKYFSDRWEDTKKILAPVGQVFHDIFQSAWDKVTGVWNFLGRYFGDRWNEVQGGINTFKRGVSDKFTELKNDVGNIFHDMINGIIDHLNDGISAVEGFINFFGLGLDKIAVALGTKGTIPEVHLGRVPHYAQGTDSHPGGFAMVGEKGRELTWLPPGAQVAPNHITEAILSMTGGKIPGYADGIGDIGSKILGWLSGGAQSILDNVLSSLHISAPSLPGMGNLASAMFDKVKSWALSWVDSIMPKFSMGGQAVNVPGSVQSWIMQAMGITGVPGSWAGPLGVIAMHESGGNPAIVNTWDSNAAAGTPSEGLFQTIMPTFMAHAIAGHLNILNPIDNAIAAIRYIQGRYGDVFHVPGIMSMASGGSYVGYANGGVIDEPISGVGLRTGTKYAFGERGKELVTPYVPSGVNLAQSYHAPATPSQSGQGRPVILMMNNREVARGIMPALTDEIRYAVNVQGM